MTFYQTYGNAFYLPVADSEEETTTAVIDNDSTTCGQLTGSDGCTKDKVQSHISFDF